LQHAHLPRRNGERAVRERHQIVEQRDLRQRHLASDDARVDRPREVRRDAPLIDDRAGDPQGRGADARRFLAEEGAEHVLDVLVPAALVRFVPYRLALAVVGEESEARARSTDIAGEDHEAPLYYGRRAPETPTSLFDARRAHGSARGASIARTAIAAIPRAIP